MPCLSSSHCSRLPRAHTLRRVRGLSAVGIYMKRVPFHFHKVPGGSAEAPQPSPHSYPSPPPAPAVACAPRPEEDSAASLLIAGNLHAARGGKEPRPTARCGELESQPHAERADWNGWKLRPGIGLREAGSQLLLPFLKENLSAGVRHFRPGFHLSRQQRRAEAMGQVFPECSGLLGGRGWGVGGRGRHGSGGSCHP